jgi:hypothetical protein
VQTTKVNFDSAKAMVPRSHYALSMAQSAGEQSREAESRKWTLSLFWLMPVLVFIYVLSIGPAYRFFPGPALPVVYRPLTQLESRFKPLDRFMTWYMEDVWKCGVW